MCITRSSTKCRKHNSKSSCCRRKKRMYFFKRLLLVLYLQICLVQLSSEDEMKDKWIHTSSAFEFQPMFQPFPTNTTSTLQLIPPYQGCNRGTYWENSLSSIVSVHSENEKIEWFFIVLPKLLNMHPLFMRESVVGHNFINFCPYIYTSVRCFEKSLFFAFLSYSDIKSNKIILIVIVKSGYSKLLIPIMVTAEGFRYLYNLILLCGDIEENPGPGINAPGTCCFYRVMIQAVFGQDTPLIPRKDKDGNIITETVSEEARITEMKKILGDGFVLADNVFKNYKKNDKNRVVQSHKVWSRDDCAGMKKYYQHFSPSNFLSLDAESKKQHSIAECRGCNSHLSPHHPFSALYPCKSRAYTKSKNINKTREDK